MLPASCTFGPHSPRSQKPLAESPGCSTQNRNLSQYFILSSCYGVWMWNARLIVRCILIIYWEWFLFWVLHAVLQHSHSLRMLPMWCSMAGSNESRTQMCLYAVGIIKWAVSRERVPYKMRACKFGRVLRLFWFFLGGEVGVIPKGTFLHSAAQINPSNICI